MEESEKKLPVETPEGSDSMPGQHDSEDAAAEENSMDEAMKEKRNTADGQRGPGQRVSPKQMIAAAAFVLVVFFVLFVPLMMCLANNSPSYDGDHNSGEPSHSYNDNDYSSSHSRSSSSSYHDDDEGSSTLLSEDDWVDASDGKTYLKSKDSDGSTSYIDTDGDYFIHRNSDGTGSIVDSDGNMGTDTDGDGSIDSVSVDGGDSWIDMD